jgi:PhzF family phenazine biosynthesis protein
MRQFLVDAFASAPFRGNPACVVGPLDVWPSDAWMLALAAENNQAETAFVLKSQDPARFGLRWFTPKLEMPLCGHATLASAHVLFGELGNDAPLLTFDTLSGPLTVKRLANGTYEMDFPARPPVQIEIPAGLEAALGVPIQEVWQGPYLAALVADEATVRDLKPDIAAIEVIATSTTGERGNLIVATFAQAGKPYDMISRFFAPGSGIPEDPATGSAHCILMPLYAHKTGKTEAQFFQAFPNRGGDIGCALAGDRVLLRGNAITVLEGVLRVSAPFPNTPHLLKHADK